MLVKPCSAFIIAHGQYPINWEAAHLTELWVVDIYKKIVNYRGILFAHSATSEACGLTTVIIFGYKEIYIPRDYFRQFIPSLPQQQVQVQPPSIDELWRRALQVKFLRVKDLARLITLALVNSESEYIG